MKQIISTISIIAILILLLPASTYAQEDQGNTALGFTVLPSIKELYLREGDEYTGKIGIKKEIKEPIPVTIEKGEYVPHLGEDRSLSEDLKDSTEWIELVEENIILEGSDVRDIVYKLEVPEGAKPGTYFTSILFQPILPDSFFKDLSVHIFPYIGGLIVVNVVDDNLDHSAPEIVEFNYRITQVAEHDFFHTKIVNESDFYKGLEGEIIVQDFTNEIIDQIEVNETRMLPKEALDLNVVAKEDLKIGYYKAKVILSDGEDLITKETRFFVFDTYRHLPWLILTFIVIGSASYVLIKMYLRRKKKKL